MMKAKLKINLLKLEKGLVFQVLEQCSLFNSRHSGINETYKSKNGIEIKSYGAPELRKNSSDKIFQIYLRGSSEEANFRIVSVEYESNKKRDADYSRIISSLKDWAENAPEFKIEEEELELEESSGCLNFY